MALALDSPLHITVTEASPRSQQPPNFQLPLKPHQLAMLQRCLDIEKTALMSPFRMGFMGDTVAAGKTAVAIAMPVVDRALYKRRQLNVIVVPQNICMQWMSEITKFTGDFLKVLFLIDYASISELTFQPSAIGKYDIVLTTPMYFTTLADFCEKGHITPKRVIVDEADTIANMVSKKIPGAMTWFVSATMDRLPESRQGMVQVGKEVTTVEEYHEKPNMTSALTTKKGGTLRSQESGTYEIPSRLLKSGERLCRCEPRWVNESFDIPPPVKTKVVVSNIIMDAVASLTYSKMLKPKQLESANARDFRNLRLGSEDEFKIMPTLLKHYEERIQDAEVTLAGLSRTMHMEKRQSECRDEISRCKSYIQAMRAVAKDLLLCQGSFEQLGQPDRSSPPIKECMLCPNCRAGYSMLWYNDTQPTMCLKCGSQQPFIGGKPQAPGLADNKVTKLGEIVRSVMKSEERPRIMIYAKYTQAFSAIRHELSDTSLVIEEADAGTPMAAEKMLDAFRSGKIDVLLAESSLFCSGMNLPEVTDVCFLHAVHKYSTAQIAGRAQRPGRVGPCRIWTFLHDNETSAYSEE